MLATIAYSDLFTLAGIQRVLGRSAVEVPPDSPSITTHVTLVRDDAIPAGECEMRFSDGTRERVALDLLPATTTRMGQNL